MKGRRVRTSTPSPRAVGSPSLNCRYRGQRGQARLNACAVLALDHVPSKLTARGVTRGCSKPYPRRRGATAGAAARAVAATAAVVAASRPAAAIIRTTLNASAFRRLSFRLLRSRGLQGCYPHAFHSTAHGDSPPAASGTGSRLYRCADKDGACTYRVFASSNPAGATFRAFQGSVEQGTKRNELPRVGVRTCYKR